MRGVIGRVVRACGGPVWATDDGLLAAHLADPDGSAFAELVARHGPMVLGVCRRILRHTQDAEDAFQATFLVLARRAGDVWPRAAVGAWLYGVAYRVAVKARAARNRRMARERPLEGDTVPAKPLQPDDAAEVLVRLIGRLPEVYRAAVVACDLDGLSRKAAPDRLGWTEGTLSGRLARARKLLADRARRAGLTLPVGGLVAVFGPTSGVEARLVAATVALIRVPAAVVPGSVGFLTEGVVTTMVTTKAKLVAVAMVAGVLGAETWVAAGSGDGPPAPSSAGVLKPVVQQPAVGTPAVNMLSVVVELHQLEDQLKWFEFHHKDRLRPEDVERLRSQVATIRAALRGWPAEMPSVAERKDTTFEPAWVAEARLQEAHRRTVEAVVVHELAARQLEAARTRGAHARQDSEREMRALAEAREATEAKEPPAGRKKPTDPCFTVYVRLPNAPEKAVPLPATGNETVLDAITAAGDAVPLTRGPDALTVWVARGKTILPVEMGALINKGEGRTNHQLQPGDKLFVQVKPW